VLARKDATPKSDMPVGLSHGLHVFFVVQSAQRRGKAIFPAPQQNGHALKRHAIGHCK
jgi:hypothetical protein